MRRLVVLVSVSAVAAGLAAIAVAAESPTWKLQSFPNPGTKQFPARRIMLSGVSCPTKSACTAVGSYYDTQLKASVTLAEGWNGRKWAAEQTTNPPESQSSGLNGVSCTSRTTCMAVGVGNTGAGDAAFAERTSNGSSWLDEPFPFISSATSSYVADVSCTTGAACTAVGSYFNSSGDDLPLAERWNGTQWLEQSVPLPSGSPFTALLNAISCPAAGKCIAVGETNNLQGPFAAIWNGETWRTEYTPVPPHLNAGALDGISCSSSSACTAVGDYVNHHGHTVALAVRWNGKKWAVQKIANYAGTGYGDLLSVSCPSARDCTAVGAIFRNGKQAPVVEGWNGTKWAIEPIAKPSPSSTKRPQLSGVSCSSKVTCTAVGSYSNNADNPKGAFIEHRS
jgi:hypothetical protein